MNHSTRSSLSKDGRKPHKGHAQLDVACESSRKIQVKVSQLVDCTRTLLNILSVKVDSNPETHAERLTRIPSSLRHLVNDPRITTNLGTNQSEITLSLFNQSLIVMQHDDKFSHLFQMPPQVQDPDHPQQSSDSTIRRVRRQARNRRIDRWSERPTPRSLHKPDGCS